MITDSFDFAIGIWIGVILTLITLYIIEKITKKDFKLKKREEMGK